MRRKISLLLLFVVVNKSQGYGVFRDGSFSKSFSSSSASASASASSFSSSSSGSYSGAGPRAFSNPLKGAPLIGGSSFASASAHADANAGHSGANANAGASAGGSGAGGQTQAVSGAGTGTGFGTGIGTGIGSGLSTGYTAGSGSFGGSIGNGGHSGSQAGAGSGFGTGTGSGTGIGSGSGSGLSTGYTAGSGSFGGSIGNGGHSGSQAGAGSGFGTGTGSRTGIGSGSGSGLSTGYTAGSGSFGGSIGNGGHSGSQAGAGSGFGTGTGSGTGIGSGSGSGLSTGYTAGSGSFGGSIANGGHSGSQAGAVTGFGSGAGSGSGIGTGYSTTAGNSGSDTGAKVGPGTGFGSGANAGAPTSENTYTGGSALGGGFGLGSAVSKNDISGSGSFGAVPSGIDKIKFSSGSGSKYNTGYITSGSPGSYSGEGSKIISGGGGSYGGSSPTLNSGQYYSEGPKVPCCKGPFPGPKGSIHDYKPAPPGGGGPDPAWLTPGTGGSIPVIGVVPTHNHHTQAEVTGTSINAGSTGLTQQLVSSLPGPSGSIYDSKPSSGTTHFPSTSGTISSGSYNKPTTPGGVNAIINTFPGSSATDGAFSHSTGSTSGATSGGVTVIGSLPGPAGSIYDSKPAPGSSPVPGGSYNQQHTSASSASGATSSALNVIGSLPGPAGSIYNSKPVIASPSSSGGTYNQQATTGSAHVHHTGTTSGIISNGANIIGTLPGPDGSIHASKPVTSSLPNTGSTIGGFYNQQTAGSTFGHPSGTSELNIIGSSPAISGDINHGKPATSTSSNTGYNFGGSYNQQTVGGGAYGHSSGTKPGSTYSGGQVIGLVPGPSYSHSGNSYNKPSSSDSLVHIGGAINKYDGSSANSGSGSIPVAVPGCDLSLGYQSKNCGGSFFGFSQSGSSVDNKSTSNTGSGQYIGTKPGTSSSTYNKPIVSSSGNGYITTGELGSTGKVTSTLESLKPLTGGATYDSKPAPSVSTSGSSANAEALSQSASLNGKGPGSTLDATFTSKPSILAPSLSTGSASGYYQTPNGPVATTGPCSLGSPGCSNTPIVVVNKPSQTPSYSIAGPGTGQLPIDKSPSVSYGGSFELEKNKHGAGSIPVIVDQPIEPTISRTPITNTNSGSGDCTGADYGLISGLCKQNNGAKPTQGFATGSVVIHKPEGLPITGDHATTLTKDVNTPLVTSELNQPGVSCSGGSCSQNGGETSSGYSGTYTGVTGSGPGADNGFATGSVLIHKPDGSTSSGSDQSGIEKTNTLLIGSESTKPGGGCSGGTCGSHIPQSVAGSSAGSYSGSSGFNSGASIESGSGQPSSGCAGGTCGSDKPQSGAGSSSGSYSANTDGSGSCSGGACGSYKPQSGAGSSAGSYSSSFSGSSGTGSDKTGGVVIGEGAGQPSGGCLGGACGSYKPQSGVGSSAGSYSNSYSGSSGTGSGCGNGLCAGHHGALSGALGFGGGFGHSFGLSKADSGSYGGIKGGSGSFSSAISSSGAGGGLGPLSNLFGHKTFGGAFSKSGSFGASGSFAKSGASSYSGAIANAGSGSYGTY